MMKIVDVKFNNSTIQKISNGHAIGIIHWKVCKLSGKQINNIDDVEMDNRFELSDFTTENHVVLYTYKPINDRWHTMKFCPKMRLDFRVFSYSDSSTERYNMQIGATNAEIEHSAYFVFVNF